MSAGMFRASCCAVVLSVLGAVISSSATAASLARPGVCEREAAKLVGKKPARIGKSIRSPKKLRDAKPKYPELPAQTRGSGMWIGEALLDAQGKVARVWVLREPQLVPAFPAFNQSIVDAIRQWEFEPVAVKGEATPVCMTVAVTLHWE